jgi:hypothetical protein
MVAVAGTIASQKTGFAGLLTHSGHTYHAKSVAEIRKLQESLLNSGSQE